MKEKLIIAYLNGECSAGEKQVLEDWIKESGDNRRYFEEIKLIWENSVADFSGIEVKSENLWAKIHQTVSTESTFTREKRSLWTPVRVAASVLLLVGLGYVSFRAVKTVQKPADLVLVETGQEKTRVALPDGSTAWLNADSRITYPEKFAFRSREVSIEGEAYFEVKRNPGKPFSVMTGYSRTEVLGTSFNVKENEESGEVILTVVSGKVAFSGINAPEVSLELVSGEQAALSTPEGSLLKTDNSNQNFLAWKTGILVFEEDSLTSVCRILSDHFKRTVLPGERNAESPVRLTATFDNRQLEDVLQIISMTLDIPVLIEDGKVILGPESN